MIVCLTGMHRSGTSLMASYLIRCGIFMGRSLAQPGPGNPKGHFEDRNFLNLHQRWLKYNKCDLLNPKKEMVIPRADESEASHLIKKRIMSFRNWGWKDPRTMLFLDFWDKLIPEAVYLFLYRDPYLVLDSLLRRKGDYHLYIKPWHALAGWLTYNQNALEFSNRHSNRCAFINIEGFNNNPEAGCEKLSDWLQYRLNFEYTKIFDANSFAATVTHLTRIYTILLKPYYSAKLAARYNSLEQKAIIPAKPDLN